MNDLIYAEIMAHATEEAWAMLPSSFKALVIDDGRRAVVAEENEKPALITIEAITRPGPKAGRLARIPIVGAITKRDSFWSSFFGGGGASVERITKALRDVAADDSISTVLLDIDSPGGTVNGLPELAAEVRRLRDSKHVVALANSLTASAAYWIASQADEVVATPEAVVGSVGVFAVHEDWSKFNERVGINPTYIFAGKYKVEGNPDAPLNDEARAHMQGLVNDAYSLFVSDVAKGRNVSPAVVRSDYGAGRALTAGAAKAAGLIDRVAGVDETMQRLMGRRADETPSPRAEGTVHDEVNSQARLALKRRRLSIAQQIYQED